MVELVIGRDQRFKWMVNVIDVGLLAVTVGLVVDD